MNFQKTIKIIAKPNSKKTEITEFDKEKNLYKVNVKAPPENNKANIDIIKFFSKLSKKKVKIIKGKTSKQKVLKLE
ncbi:MAG: DUF167 domain-containing protein [Candidatus Woesearchaeota archaeon]|jgi:hypothetical protein|nr:DUF167 domain-containing protein [Candidatus Woesearchaeota archaeon]|tara:strand:- start:69 stop:296 length:228 start_codon:yes stop_codon:yes gene_type:complete